MPTVWETLSSSRKGRVLTDVFEPAKRSEIMSRIRSRDTEPEMIVRRIAHMLGFRFRLHRSDLPGSPDLVFPRHRAVIMVHGCFWHRHPGCKYASSPKTRVRFWQQKFRSNVVRDERTETALHDLGLASHGHLGMRDEGLRGGCGTDRLVPPVRRQPGSGEVASFPCGVAGSSVSPTGSGRMPVVGS